MNLQEVCKSLLENADMSIDFSEFPKVNFDILVHGTVNNKYWKVIFECGQVVHMDTEFDDEASYEDLFLILETKVEETTKTKVTPAVQHRMDSLKDHDPVWEIYLYGDISVTLITTKFNWKLTELSKTEYEKAYA